MLGLPDQSDPNSSHVWKDTHVLCEDITDRDTLPPLREQLHTSATRRPLQHKHFFMTYFIPPQYSPLPICSCNPSSSAHNHGHYEAAYPQCGSQEACRTCNLFQLLELLREETCTALVCTASSPQGQGIPYHNRFVSPDWKTEKRVSHTMKDCLPGVPLHSLLVDHVNHLQRQFILPLGL